MALPSVPPEDQFEELHEATEAEGWQMLDARARYHLGINAEEFVRRWQAGEYPDPDGTPALNVVMALPLVGIDPFTHPCADGGP
jgi:hypothetical protein